MQIPWSRPCVGCGMGRGSRTPTVLQPGPPSTGKWTVPFTAQDITQNRRLEREPQLHLHSTPCLAHHYWALPGAWLAASLSFPQFIWTGSCSSCSLEPSWFCAGLPQRVSTMAVRQRGQGDGVREYCQEEQELETVFAGARPLSPWLLHIPFPIMKTLPEDPAVAAVQ